MSFLNSMMKWFPFFGRDHTLLKPSGFLTDYTLLKPIPEDPGILYHEISGIDWKMYHSIMVSPIEVIFSADFDPRQVTEEAVMELRDYFQEAIKKALAGVFTVTEQPGPGVFILKVAITDIVPCRTLINWISSLILMFPVHMGSAALEAEFFDSVSGKSLGAVIDRKKGSPFSLTAGFSTFGHARIAFDTWAEELKDLLIYPEGKE